MIDEVRRVNNSTHENKVQLSKSMIMSVHKDGFSDKDSFNQGQIDY